MRLAPFQGLSQATPGECSEFGFAKNWDFKQQNKISSLSFLATAGMQ
jgi:hypothetical protein